MARTSFVDVALRLRGARRFNAEVAAATKQLETMGVKGAASMGAFAQKADRFRSAGRSLTTGLTLPIAAVGAASVYAAMKWESAFTGVEKTVDATAPQLAKLNDELLDMSMNIPVSATELANIAEAAGQLGIKTGAIASFTRVMADLGVATDMTSTDAADQLARFANITQMPQTQFERLGSTVVALGNKLAATESEIVNMGMRIAGAGNQVGLTEAQIMGFAGALSSVGIRAEMGGTAISQTFLKANSAVLAGGGELQKWASIAGTTAVGFRKQWESNAGLAMTNFLSGLKEMSDNKRDVAGTLKELGLSGTRVGDVLLRASGNVGLFRKALGLGTKSWKQNSALQEEASKRYKTFESRLQILKNTIFAVGVIIGDALLPPLIKIADYIGPKILAAAKWFKNLDRPIKIAIVAVIGFLAILGPALMLLGAIATGVGVAMMIATSPITLVVLAIVAFIAILVLAYKKVGWFRAAVQFMFKVWKTEITLAIKGVVAAFNWLKTAVTNTKNWITTAWNNVVGFVKGLPGKIRSATSGMWNGIKESFRSALNWIINAWNGLNFRIPEIKAFGKSIGGFEIGTPDIPGLATGGTVTRSGSALVGERGPEILSLPRGASVIPLSSNQRIEVPVYLDGRQIALAVAGQVSTEKARA